MSENYKKYINILQSNPLFNDIPADNIISMLNNLNAYTKDYHKDVYIKHIGDSADFIGIVLSGNIHILQDDYYGNRYITASIPAGVMFAEAFACAGIAQLPVDIIAVDNCTILFLDSRTILNACSSVCDASCSYHHILIKNLLGIVAHKNIFLNQKLKCLSYKTTREKLLAYLSLQAKQHSSDEFTIPFNRQELADYLGVERSAMSAEIGKLVKAGILETRRSYFKLLKHISLEY